MKPPDSQSRYASAALQFHEAANSALQDLKTTQLDNIVAAAKICAHTITRSGLVFLFGSGHSRMMVDEMTPRQGCFVGFYPLVELSVSNYSAIIGPNGLRAPLHLEKYEGYAEEVLKGFRFGPEDSFIVISTSGIRPLVVEMALGAKARHLPVIAIVSRTHCENAKPTHSSGKKLIDVADVVIDNLSPVGDCAVALERPLACCSTVDTSRSCCPATSLSATLLPKTSWKISTKRIVEAFDACTSD